MVQKEVKKKTKIYGTVAVLSAIVLISMIYVMGSVPQVFPPSETPPVLGMKTFSSLEALTTFLTTKPQGQQSYVGGPLDSQFFGERALSPVQGPPSVTGGKNMLESAPSYSVDSSYSTTNIQVQGVDEADTVKTDGKYIYAISNAQNFGFYMTQDSAGQTGNSIYIINADPQNAKVVSKITLANNTQPAGMFLSQDSTKLVVLASKYEIYTYDTERSTGAMLMPYQSDVFTFINVYDISNKANPILFRNFTMSGSYFNSRMINNYVYTVVSQPAYVTNNSVTLPVVCEKTVTSPIEPTSVRYAEDTVDNYFTFTTFVGLNIMDATQQPTNMTILMGGTSTMYVSTQNIYVTYPTYTPGGQYTSVYRVRINGSQLTFETQGNVPGYLLNQYSMDEYQGYFRVATTWGSTGGPFKGPLAEEPTSMNNIYVLNMNLSIVGRLENLAKDERIFSSRFIGDKAYLVTFRQVDPFFVIDLSYPASPKVAGELKIPGYSSYLHPYDENYMIGLGKENNTVKLSLFDVSNVNKPTEVAKYVIDGDYTDSSALYEPKAFLFNKQKELLVIPVSITKYGVIDSGNSLGGKEVYDYSQGSYWQGAYVFRLTASGGFEYRGGITHITNTNASTIYLYDYNLQVERALYIGNTLYTISNAQVKLNSLTNLAEITTINLN
jgi:uncharacterized secreted protein with C-terminal beta-propeller domain